MNQTRGTRAEWKVSVGADVTSAIYDPPATFAGDGIVFVAAHGAGGSMHDRAMTASAAALSARGVGVVRFNFLYKEKKSSRPDPMPRLGECISAVVTRVRAELAPDALIIGGRSMGGRAASMLAAAGFACDGLLLLAYPLHPSGQPEKLRDAHLSQIRVPVLAISGTRDALCRRDLMEAAVKGVTARWRMHWIEGADHSFHVLKSTGRTDAEVMEEIGDTARTWAVSLRAG